MEKSATINENFQEEAEKIAAKLNVYRAAYYRQLENMGFRWKVGPYEAKDGIKNLQSWLQSIESLLNQDSGTYLLRILCQKMGEGFERVCCYFGFENHIAGDYRFSKEWENVLNTAEMVSILQQLSIKY